MGHVCIGSYISFTCTASLSYNMFTGAASLWFTIASGNEFVHMYRITFRAPYTGEMRIQSFDSYQEAMIMIEFYRSCGVTARVAPPQ